MSYDYMKFQLDIFEAGQPVKRIAGFEQEGHAIKFTDSILNDLTVNQFAVVGGTVMNIVYIRQGKKKVKAEKTK